MNPSLNINAGSNNLSETSYQQLRWDLENDIDNSPDVCDSFCPESGIYCKICVCLWVTIFVLYVVAVIVGLILTSVFYFKCIQIETKEDCANQRVAFCGAVITLFALFGCCCTAVYKKA